MMPTAAATADVGGVHACGHRLGLPQRSSKAKLRTVSLGRPAACLPRGQLSLSTQRYNPSQCSACASSTSSSDATPPGSRGGAGFVARQFTLGRIHSCGVIACLRSANEAVALHAARAALEGGLSVLEVTMTTSGAFQVIKTLVREYPSATIGAGTILTWQDAERAKEAGATFLTSPLTDKELVLAHRSSDVLFIPGTMTPCEVRWIHASLSEGFVAISKNENDHAPCHWESCPFPRNPGANLSFGTQASRQILQAGRWGASCVKLYPVSMMGGVHYVEMLKKLFPNTPIIASNGISLDTAKSYLQRGSTAVILSDAVFNKIALSHRDYAQILHLSKMVSAFSTSFSSCRL